MFPNCFSCKFLSDSLSGFPRHAKAITPCKHLSVESKSPSQYVENFRTSLKERKCRTPKKSCSGPLIAADLGSEETDILFLSFLHAGDANVTWFYAILS